MSEQVQDLKSLTESELIDLALSCEPEQEGLRRKALMEHSERTRSAPETAVSQGLDLKALEEKVKRLKRCQ